MLINPNLNPVTPPVVQNLTLHSTLNSSTVISDVFNIIGKLFIDSTSSDADDEHEHRRFWRRPDGEFELVWHGSFEFSSTAQFALGDQ